jgi:hypothetical protein
MATTIISGQSSNGSTLLYTAPSPTRIVILYMEGVRTGATAGQVGLYWGASGNLVSQTSSLIRAFGANIAYQIHYDPDNLGAFNFNVFGENLVPTNTQSTSAEDTFIDALPVELLLDTGHQFYALCGPYNCVAIPEAG